MLYSCTLIATVGIKGLMSQSVSSCQISSTRAIDKSAFTFVITVAVNADMSLAASHYHVLFVFRNCHYRVGCW